MCSCPPTPLNQKYKIRYNQYRTRQDSNTQLFQTTGLLQKKAYLHVSGMEHTDAPRVLVSIAPSAMRAAFLLSHLAVDKAPRVALVEDKRRHGVVRRGEAEVLLGDGYVFVDLVERAACAATQAPNSTHTSPFLPLGS